MNWFKPACHIPRVAN